MAEVDRVRGGLPSSFGGGGGYRVQQRRDRTSDQRRQSQPDQFDLHSENDERPEEVERIDLDEGGDHHLDIAV